MYKIFRNISIIFWAINYFLVKRKSNFSITAPLCLYKSFAKRIYSLNWPHPQLALMIFVCLFCLIVFVRLFVCLLVCLFIVCLFVFVFFAIFFLNYNILTGNMYIIPLRHIRYIKKCCFYDKCLNRKHAKELQSIYI